MLSEYLQYVILPKVSRAECVKDYEDSFDIPEHQSCYGFREGGKDSCKVNVVSVSTFFLRA